ncbi:thioesterase II family protein [Streptomyces sp. NPDC054884]|uniref:thioesterase II family protein n=1 Tax=Streptomyces sp. ME08-AFT2 TaxID=3028683 RepID=UPI0029A534E8|nr:alpha/beta fold hydrolase [Streptomyces sp. ME08-AFT2]MDX3311421.1 alpha/beta fold hydrolase [Streptomyces sp. ME08-AFT2]
MASRSSAEHKLWMRNFHPSSPGAPRLVCLPHAGGSASFYFPVSAALAPEVEVLAVQYPGRQDRRLDPPAESVEALADELFSVLDPQDDTPLALFGHSMGAVVGFELARRLEAAGRPLAVFFASGRRGPSRVRSESVHRRDDAGLLEEIKKLNGTDLALLDDEEMLQMIMPALRADYRLVETYERGPGPRLSCPVVAMTGDADPRVTIDEARSWAEETSGAFELLVHPGGHFYLAPRQRAVNAQIAEYLHRIAPRTEAQA